MHLQRPPLRAGLDLDQYQCEYVFRQSHEFLGATGRPVFVYMRSSFEENATTLSGADPRSCRIAPTQARYGRDDEVVAGAHRVCAVGEGTVCDEPWMFPWPPPPSPPHSPPPPSPHAPPPHARLRHRRHRRPQRILLPRPPPPPLAAPAAVVPAAAPVAAPVAVDPNVVAAASGAIAAPAQRGPACAAIAERHVPSATLVRTILRPRPEAYDFCVPPAPGEASASTVHTEQACLRGQKWASCATCDGATNYLLGLHSGAFPADNIPIATQRSLGCDRDEECETCGCSAMHGRGYGMCTYMDPVRSLSQVCNKEVCPPPLAYGTCLCFATPDDRDSYRAFGASRRRTFRNTRFVHVHAVYNARRLLLAGSRRADQLLRASECHHGPNSFLDPAPGSHMSSPSSPSSPPTMSVLKRNGDREPVSFDKILRRISALSTDLSYADPVRSPSASSRASTTACGPASSTSSPRKRQPVSRPSTPTTDFSPRAQRSPTCTRMTEASIAAVYFLLADDVREFAQAHQREIDAAFLWELDFKYDYFGFKTLERSYLSRDPTTNKVVERPQVLLMRVALGIHCGHLEDALETFRLMARGAFTHATPTMFNAGTKTPCLASCFLLPVQDDSIEGIAETWEAALSSPRSAGGIGFSCSNVRASGEPHPLHRRPKLWLGADAPRLRQRRALRRPGRRQAQGGLRGLPRTLAPRREASSTSRRTPASRSSARATSSTPSGSPTSSQRVEENAPWSLFCPSRCPDLVDLHGVDFERRYLEYERAGLAEETLPSQDLWFAILDSQIETGTVHALQGRGQRRIEPTCLGTIRSSNLCTEIIQYSSKDEIAVCNLASLSLPSFVVEGAEAVASLERKISSTEGDVVRAFDLDALARVTKIVTRNLNRVIDRNGYARPGS